MMLFTITFASLIVLVAGDKCVNYYFFNEDYTRYFDSRGCGGDEPWEVVKYSSVGIIPPGGSATGLITSSASCISSFPKEYSAGGVLKILVYSTVECNTQVTIHNHEDDSVMASSTFVPEHDEKPNIKWKEIIIRLEDSFSGFIRLRGSCKHKKYNILIDSIQYYLNKPSKDCHNFKSKSVVLEDEDASEFIPYDDNHDLFDLFRDGSGDGEPEGGNEDGSDNNSGASWNAITISLTVIGVGTGVALIAYGAYYYGQSRAINEVDRFLVNDLETEPQSTITLPRVRPALRI